jgi:phage-related protein
MEFAFENVVEAVENVVEAVKNVVEAVKNVVEAVENVVGAVIPGLTRDPCCVGQLAAMDCGSSPR